jgi:hypothetical protein
MEPLKITRSYLPEAFEKVDWSKVIAAIYRSDSSLQVCAPGGGYYPEKIFTPAFRALLSCVFTEF